MVTEVGGGVAEVHGRDVDAAAMRWSRAALCRVPPPRNGAARTGPLARPADSFVARLKELGYSEPATRSHLGLLLHLSRWLTAEGLDVVDLTPRRPTGSSGLVARTAT